MFYRSKIRTEISVPRGLGSECRCRCSKTHRPATLRVCNIRRLMHLADIGQHKPAPGRFENLAGVEGFEPANAGIKIRCLNQLGDTPTQDNCRCRQPTYKSSLANIFSRAAILPAGQRMHFQIAAFSNDPVARSGSNISVMQNLCKYSTSRASHASLKLLRF